MKSDVTNLSSKNEKRNDVSKKELVEQIRCNYIMQAEYTLSYKEIENKVDKHIENCCLKETHFFYETEPVCQMMGKSHQEICKTQCNIAITYLFIKHLSTKGKRSFFKTYLLDLIMVDVDTLRFYLDNDNYGVFEPCFNKLLLYIGQLKIIKYLSFIKYKKAIKKHLEKCKGPCKLNTIGFPICDKTKQENDKMDQMQAGLHLFYSSSVNITDCQILFDYSYVPEKHNAFLELTSINILNNNCLCNTISNFNKNSL